MLNRGRTSGVSLRAPRAFTFVEVILAFFILASFFLSVYYYLTNSVKETERAYVEAVAISHAKFVMDTVMFQLPWRCIRSGNPCKFEDPKNSDPINTILNSAIPKMFGTGCAGSTNNSFLGDGMMVNSKGFFFRVRMKCTDIDSVAFRVGGKIYECKDLTANDADGKPSLMKKLVLQILWTMKKGVDPVMDPLAQSLFLVAYKSDLER